MEKGIYSKLDIRCFRKKDFEIENFINEIEALPTLRAKLEKFNEYYDLIQRGTTEIMIIDTNQPLFGLECSTCEGRWKGKWEDGWEGEWKEEGYEHNNNNTKEIKRFIYEKAQEAAQEFESITSYKKRVQTFFERFGNCRRRIGRKEPNNLEKIWYQISIDHVMIEGYQPTHEEYKNSEKAIISIKPNNAEERLILNIFHYDRLLIEYQAEFEERKKSFEKNYRRLGLNDAERMKILTDEQNLAKTQKDNRINGETSINEIISDFSKGYTSYFERVGSKEKFDFSIEPIYENSEMYQYFDARFDIEYIEFINNYTPNNSLPPPKDKTGEEKKVRQPITKVIITFIGVIEEHTTERFYPTVFNDNTEKYQCLAQKIKEKFKYDYNVGTLENARNGIDTDNNEEIEKVINLLNTWNYSDVATKYRNALKRY